MTHKYTVKPDMQRWTCGKCGHINKEYYPWPVNAECENCGHAQVFGEAVWPDEGKEDADAG